MIAEAPLFEREIRFGRIRVPGRFVIPTGGTVLPESLSETEAVYSTTVHEDRKIAIINGKALKFQGEVAWGTFQFYSRHPLRLALLSEFDQTRQVESRATAASLTNDLKKRFEEVQAHDILASVVSKGGVGYVLAGYFLRSSVDFAKPGEPIKRELIDIRRDLRDDRTREAFDILVSASDQEPASRAVLKRLLVHEGAAEGYFSVRTQELRGLLLDNGWLLNMIYGPQQEPYFYITSRFENPNQEYDSFQTIPTPDFLLEGTDERGMFERVIRSGRVSEEDLIGQLYGEVSTRTRLKFNNLRSIVNRKISQQSVVIVRERLRNPNGGFSTFFKISKLKELMDEQAKREFGRTTLQTILQKITTPGSGDIPKDILEMVLAEERDRLLLGRERKGTKPYRERVKEFVLSQVLDSLDNFYSQDPEDEIDQDIAKRLEFLMEQGYSRIRLLEVFRKHFGDPSETSKTGKLLAAL